MAKNRRPMPVSERAKQFMPFAAVTGLTQALRRKERELMRVEKKEPSEERVQKLNQYLNEIKKGDDIVVTYFSQGEYLTVTGIVEGLDTAVRVLDVGGMKLQFDDIYDIVKGDQELEDKDAAQPL